MFIDKEVARRMEACIKQSHIEVTQQYNEGRIVEINGGAACFSGFDSFLSQVVGWGFATKPKQFKTELARIEQFYSSLQHPRVDIELCPFVGNDLAVFLSQRGYVVSELNNVSVLNLQHYTADQHLANEFTIKEMQPYEIDQWAKIVAEGFGYPEAREQFTHYARSKGITAFAALYRNKIIAGATLAMHGDVCDLGVTSTLEAFRGKGLQKKLLSTRLAFAKSNGLALATVTTTPGTISDLNVQKTGFRCAYTRIKMTLLAKGQTTL